MARSRSSSPTWTSRDDVCLDEIMMSPTENFEHRILYKLRDIPSLDKLVSGNMISASFIIELNSSKSPTATRRRLVSAWHCGRKQNKTIKYCNDKEIILDKVISSCDIWPNWEVRRLNSKESESFGVTRVSDLLWKVRWGISLAFENHAVPYD